VSPFSSHLFDQHNDLKVFVQAKSDGKLLEMYESGRDHQLPKKLDRYLAALSTMYAQDGKRLLQEIIVNAHPNVVEETDFDNLNGGMYGHTLHLTIPESVFLQVVKKKSAVETEIRENLNQVQNVSREFISDVFIEMAETGNHHDWRKESGLLIVGSRPVSPDHVDEIWGTKGFRVFLSHKSVVKKETGKLRDQLKLYGGSSFVAHVDIQPTQEWQDKIEDALMSMEAFVALMTPDFHDSDWTDQEVGFALARGVPIIAVRLGRDPYGFIGKFQALSATWETAAEEIASLLIAEDRMFNAYIHAIRNCVSWEDGNEQAKVLPRLRHLAAHQIDMLVEAFNETTKLHGSFGFNGKVIHFGPGLVHHLNRLGSRRFVFANDRSSIELAT
jgi:hypothetical protein